MGFYKCGSYMYVDDGWFFKVDMDYESIVLEQFIPGKLTSDTGSACTRALPLLRTNDLDWSHLIGNKISCVIMLS